MTSAPPAALTLKKVRLLSVFDIRRLLKRRPRDESRGGCVDMYRIGRCCPTWQRQCPRRWVSVSLQEARQRTSVVPIDSSRTEEPARQSRPPAKDDSMSKKGLRSS